MDIEQQRARGIAGIGAMHLAAGQAPEQEAIHGAEAQLAAFGPLTGTRHMLENPAQLAGGEIRVDQQAGAGVDQRLMACSLERGAVIRGAPILPDDGRVDRLTRCRVPHQGGLTLIGDADGADVRCLQTALAQCLAADRQGAEPEILRIVLDPAIGGKVLSKLLLSTGPRSAMGIEDDCPAAGGALIDSQKVVAHGVSLLLWLRRKNVGGSPNTGTVGGSMP